MLLGAVLEDEIKLKPFRNLSPYSTSCKGFLNAITEKRDTK
jgi:hypothetical protein